MTVAEHLHYAGDLRDLMRTMSHRQFLMWQERIRREWNQPDRTDHYLMQIAQRVCNVLGGKMSLGDMKIEFKEKAVTEDWTQPSAEQVTMSQSSWMVAMGVTK